MKKTIMIILIIIELFIIKIPKYVELNDLAIIEEVTVEKNNNMYTLTLKEIIPIKENQGIKYQYKYYKNSATSIKKAYEKISNNTKKKFYLNKVKLLKTNLITSNEIKEELNINPNSIHHNVINYSSNSEQEKPILSK